VGSTIRKQVYDLTPDDLDRHPIWEHALDEEGDEAQDEATVKPRPDLVVADPGEGLVLARAVFVAADGTRFDGYVYPQFDDYPGGLQPTIVNAAGQVNFWLGAFPRLEQLPELYRALGKSAAQLFPIRYRAAVEHRGVPLEGEITAFRHRRSVSDETVVEVT
jgi:hypothetical protein